VTAITVYVFSGMFAPAAKEKRAAIERPLVVEGNGTDRTTVQP
jgi:hypothetical protein